MIYNCCQENRKDAVLNNPASILASPAVNAPGSGYAVADVLTIAQAGSSGTATVTVATVNATGGVTGITLSQNGALYSTASAVHTTGGKGTGCTINLTGSPNGIDYLEVASSDPSQAPTTLLVYCLKGAPANLTSANVLITGGESITNITIANIQLGLAPNILQVTTGNSGDFSTYTLRLVNFAHSTATDSLAVTEVLAGFDPRLAEVDFSFRILSGPEFDCKQDASPSPPTLPTSPPINYLAKDYGSFRTLILDRLNQLLPSWGATSEADLGIALAELIAYRADYLSYQQDAVATEAYLHTARSRISLRRHALLMDYNVHDGCNARAWMHIVAAGNPNDQIFLDRTLTRFYTYAPGMPSTLARGTGNEETALLSGVQVFEPMHDAILYPDHNVLHFHTWGDTNCCLPAGATEATLAGTHANLSPGDVLVFAEVLGPKTGIAADADLRHRCAVRLTKVATKDARGQLLVDPLFDSSGNFAANPAPVTKIQWSSSDALAFPVCISSSYLEPDTGDTIGVADVSVALGNMVLADHGLSIWEDIAEAVPQPRIFYPPAQGSYRCILQRPNPLPLRYRPALNNSLVTQAVPLGLAGSPVTPNIIPLNTTPVSLPDANGLICLTVEANNPGGWPALFGVLVAANASTAGNFDLSVVYNPPGGAAGIAAPPVVEHFSNLSVITTDPNYVFNIINQFSNLLRVPASYIPPAAAPAGFSSGISALPLSGLLNLQDTSSPPVTYLSLQTKSPSTWPNYFGVIAQSVPPQAPGACCTGSKPDFNLLVVYDPPSTGVGVSLPATIELLTRPPQPTLPGIFNPGSRLVTLHTFSQAPDQRLSARDLISSDPRVALPEVCLCGTLNGVTDRWIPRQDLLGSQESDRVFAMETESDGTSILRFATPVDAGSSEATNGLVPAPGTSFRAFYRVGNGAAGNVGAESLVFHSASDARIQSCTNPLPASGGIDPETNEQIRRRAPLAFLAQERAVTMPDYQAAAEENTLVSRAVASLRWTGSWYSVFVAAERMNGGSPGATLLNDLTRSLDTYRLAGQDLKLDSPQYISLQITLEIEVHPEYFQQDVEESLLQVLGNKTLPNGNRGIFSPDNFTFGQTVYLSPVYAAARSVSGILTVNATQFQPQGMNTSNFLNAGAIPLGSLQIARLENDPSFPDHGQLTLVMHGGK